MASARGSAAPSVQLELPDRTIAGPGDIEVLPAYVIEWSTQFRRLRFLPTAADLAHELDPHGAERLEGSFKRLFVVHDMPSDYVVPLQAALGVDPLFVKAHLWRQRYSPLRRRPGDRWVVLEYPELCAVVGDGEVGAAGAPEYALSDNGPDVVLFCRAALWLNGENDGVLFLDKAPWSGPSPRLRKETSVVTIDMMAHATPARAEGAGEGIDEHSASLEIILQEALRDPDQMRDGITALLQELAYNHWLIYFESPLIDPETNSAHILALAWRTQLCLEHNLNVTRYLARHRISRAPGGLGADEWDGLLGRNGRRVELATLAAGGSEAIAKEFRVIQQGVSDDTKEISEAHNRSLDRISYMGGIAFPITLVSAILSMAEPFDPFGRYYWAFWVIAIPVTMISLLIIYADSIRKATVWIEVGGEEDTGKTGAQGRQSQHAGNSGNGQTKTGLLPLYSKSSGSQSNAQGGPTTDDEVPLNPGVQEVVESFPMMVVQAPHGGKPKTFKKQELGWAGAVKSMVGYEQGQQLRDPKHLSVPAPGPGPGPRPHSGPSRRNTGAY